MKLLITTQIVNKEDPTLGFFHRWIEELAKHYESIQVVCLYEGTHTLPGNVEVHSLGKEKERASKVAYAIRLKLLAFKLRSKYDAVFVHMNQEHVLVAGLLWNMLGKPVYMWRNHYAGSYLTDVAACLCKNVFCTSQYSYTAKYKKTILMPVGVDVKRFSSTSAEGSTPGSILFLARMAPSKRAELLIEALGILKEKRIPFTASLYGSPLPKDEAYYKSLQDRSAALGLEGDVKFHPGVKNEEASRIYRRHEIFVNCSTSGMFDKTIFEAAASGCLVLAQSADFAELAGKEFFFDSAVSLAAHLERMLSEPSAVKEAQIHTCTSLAYSQSLTLLGERLAQEIKSH